MSLQLVRITNLCPCTLNSLFSKSKSHPPFSASKTCHVFQCCSSLDFFCHHVIVFSFFQRKTLLLKHLINLVLLQYLRTILKWYIEQLSLQISAWVNVCIKLEGHIQMYYSYLRKNIFITSVKDELQRKLPLTYLPGGEFQGLKL